MNYKEKGKERDQTILRTLESWECMDSHQIACMLFSDIYWSHKKAQERLLSLHKKGRVKRWKGEEGYIYSLDKKRGRADHKHALNWVRVWMSKKLMQKEKIHCFKYEDDYGFIRPDAFVAVKNTEFDTFKFYFVEMDLSANPFDKIEKYNRLFEQQELIEERWWAKLTDRFPLTLIVTTTESRKKKILEHIEQENKNNLRFNVLLLSDIKREVRR